MKPGGKFLRRAQSWESPQKRHRILKERLRASRAENLVSWEAGVGGEGEKGAQVAFGKLRGESHESQHHYTRQGPVYN